MSTLTVNFFFFFFVKERIIFIIVIEWQQTSIRTWILQSWYSPETELVSRLTALKYELRLADRGSDGDRLNHYYLDRSYYSFQRLTLNNFSWVTLLFTWLKSNIHTKKLIVIFVESRISRVFVNFYRSLLFNEFPCEKCGSHLK